MRNCLNPPMEKKKDGAVSKKMIATSRVHENEKPRKREKRERSNKDVTPKHEGTKDADKVINSIANDEGTVAEHGSERKRQEIINVPLSTAPENDKDMISETTAPQRKKNKKV